MKGTPELYFIAELADDEVSNPEDQKRFKNEIEKNSDLKYEFNVQAFTKEINEPFHLNSCYSKLFD